MFRIVVTPRAVELCQCSTNINIEWGRKGKSFLILPEIIECQYVIFRIVETYPRYNTDIHLTQIRSIVPKNKTQLGTNFA